MCDATGLVRIRARDGRTYALSAESPPKPIPGSRRTAFERFLQHRRMLKSLGAVAPGPKAAERIHRIIAGEI
jgi:hypothetical protein